MFALTNSYYTYYRNGKIIKVFNDNKLHENRSTILLLRLNGISWQIIRIFPP